MWDHFISCCPEPVSLSPSSIFRCAYCYVLLYLVFMDILCILHSFQTANVWFWPFFQPHLGIRSQSPRERTLHKYKHWDAYQVKELLKTDISRKRKLLPQLFHVTQRDESVKERWESRHQVHGNAKSCESCNKGRTVECCEELVAVKKREVIKSFKINCVQS